MALLTNEQVLFKKNGLIITNLRVRNEKGKFCSILIKNVSSISISSKNYPAWLIASGFLFMFGTFVYKTFGVESSSFFLILAIVLLAAYFLTIQKTITISSNGGDSISYEGDFSQSIELADIIEKVQLE